MALDARKQQILQAIVDDYIETAEPVASKALVSKHDFHVSSATVRNEMAELEQLGYLEQPHTSAGRVPSDKGYREYVDSLMQVETLSNKEARELSRHLSDSFEELTVLLKRASAALAESSGYMSLALSPRLRKSYLKQLKLMMIEPGKALVVVVLSAGVVKDKLVRISDYLSADQLLQISQTIEAELCGKPLEEITLVTVTAAAKDTRLPESLLNQVLYEAYTAIKQADNLELFLEGSHRMLAYPEFHDINRARELFDALARDGMIAGYIDEIADHGQDSGGFAQSAPSYMIRIGQEIQLAGLSECSFITTTYNVGNKIAGNIGIIGPRRMEYSKVISQINFVRNSINSHMKRLNETNGGRNQS